MTTFDLYMHHRSDILFFSILNRCLTLGIAEVRGVADAEKIFFMPGSKPPIRGMIAYRGEVVAVVDLKHAFGLDHAEPGPYTIVIAGDDKKSIGLCAGGDKPSFILAEELKDTPRLAAEAGAAGRQSKWVGILSTMQYKDKTMEFINWESIYDEAKRTLSGH